MDLKKHFEDYRNSLKKDIFDGYGEVAKSIPTKSSEYPTLYDTIVVIKEKIDKTVEEADLTSYKSYLIRHQSAFIKLFEKMVSNELESMEKNTERLLNLIEVKGLKWFKFSKGYIAFDKMVYVPRLTAVTPEFKYWGSVLFDADEIALFNNTKISKKRAQKLLVEKGQGFLKLMTIRPRTFIFREVGRLNVEDRVSDWTGVLFNEERERF